VITVEELAAGRTLAEVQGMPAELGEAIAALAGEALAADRLEVARRILEGLVATNPRDPVAWALLSTALRRRGEPEAARLCAEAAVRLAPGAGPPSAQLRLVRAEAMLAGAAEREEGRRELEALSAQPGSAGDRARALLRALGR
jgi:predicted Zn-dependent protease